MSMGNKSVLEQLQERIVTQLQASTAFADSVVLSENSGKIDYEIEQGLATLGQAVIVRWPIPLVISPNLPGPTFGEVQLTVRIIENAALHEGLSALGTAERVLAVLHQAAFDLSGGNRVFVTCARNAITQESSAEGEVILDCNFITDTGLTCSIN